MTLWKTNIEKLIFHLEAFVDLDIVGRRLLNGKLVEALTDSSLTNDPGQTKEEHHAPDVEETSHLESNSAIPIVHRTKPHRKLS